MVEPTENNRSSYVVGETVDRAPPSNHFDEPEIGQERSLLRHFFSISFFTQILFTLSLISSLFFAIHTSITLNSKTLYPSDEIPYSLLSMQKCIDDVKVMDGSEQT